MPAKNPHIPESVARRLQAIGLHIRRQRKALKVSATVAAESAGMSRVTWHRIEKGEPAVTMGAYLNALAVVGLEFDVLDTAARRDHKDDGDDRKKGWIPARIHLADYPQLRQLAWHVRETDTLSAREAFDIYERNARHLDEKDMAASEKELLEALRAGFGTSGDAGI